MTEWLCCAEWRNNDGKAVASHESNDSYIECFCEAKAYIECEAHIEPDHREGISTKKLYVDIFIFVKYIPER